MPKTNRTTAHLLETFIGRAINFALTAPGTLDERAAAGVAHASDLCRNGERGLNRAALDAVSLQLVDMTSRVCTSVAIRTETKPVRPQTRRGSKEWNRAWACLAAEFGDTVQDHADENWQYMGQAAGLHEFRHRSHPVHGRIVWRTAVAS